MYHALYRKYRPIDFNSVVGQDIIVKTLRNSIINNSFSHAYIFFGSRGTGKTTLSKIFARSINCTDPIDGCACGKCDNCKISFSKECVDIIEIDAASNNGVDEIRELRNKISLVPSDLKYKVYIIDEVHMLSSGAFNALLKTLEEPPEHAIFILATTELQKVPETIVSRCQCFSFKRIPNESIINRLKLVCEKEKISCEENILKEIAISSNGGLRDALGFLDKLASYSSNNITMSDFYDLMGSISYNQIVQFVNFVFSNDVEKVLSNINEFHNSGKNFIQIIYQIINYLTDIIEKYFISQLNLEFSYDDYFNLLNILVDKLNEFKKSTNVCLLFEIYILMFIHNNNNIDSSSSSVNSSFINDDNKEISSNLADNKTIVNNDSNLIHSIDNIDNNINHEEDVKFNDKEYQSDLNIRKIVNINDIMNVRINNTLANADKKLLKNEISNFELLKDFTFDQEIGYIVCSLLDSKVRVVSSDSMIISFMYDSNVKQNLLIIDKINEVYNKITNSNKKIAIVSDSEWDKIKTQYITNIKNNISYSLQEEPEVIFEDLENNDIINNRAIELFGNIVEID